jgi:hypothetical protein
MELLKLTDDNYYSREANWQYMSASQFKAFRRCEAAAMAELHGDWEQGESIALLTGSYVDAYFSGELPQFKRRTPELFKKDGTLKADFIKAHAIARRLEQDGLARMLLAGGHQVIKTGQIGGVWYKAKFDSLLEEEEVDAICDSFPAVREMVPFGGGMIVDLKCMRDFEDVWDEAAHERVNWVNYWGYDIQGAIYQHLDGRHAPFVIVGATKDTEPDITAVNIPDEELAVCLEDVKALSQRYAAIKRGEIAPTGCGRCAYCRSRKKLTGIKHYREV